MSQSFTSGAQRVFCCLVIAAMSGSTAGAQLSSEQQDQLQQMDASLAEKIVSASDKIRRFRDAIDLVANKAFIAGNDPGGTSIDPPEVTAVIADIAVQTKSLESLHPAISELLQYEQKIGSVLDQAEQSWKNVPYEAEKAEGLDEKQFREKLRQKARGAASRQIREHLTNVVFPGIERQRGPAEYAQSFLNGEFRRWISQPVAIDEQGSLMLRVLPPQGRVAPFSKAANLGIEIEYLPGELKVEGQGLYFRYREGQLPEPVLDEIRIGADVQQMALNKVTALGQEMLAETLGSPIQIKLKGSPNFSPGFQGLRGGIPFDAQFTVFETVTVKGSDFVLYPGNTVDWKSGALKIDYQLPAPILIPSTPFAFWTMGGEYGPRTRKLAFETKISTATTPPQALALEVMCGTTLPIKSIEVKGKLTTASIALAEADGKLDFERGTLDASYTATQQGAMIVPGFSLGSGKLHLQREMLIVDADMTLYGKTVDDVHGEFRFDNGSGKLTAADGSLELFGADFSSTTQAEIGPGFGYLTLRAVGSVQVPDIPPFGTLSCTVIVEGDTRNSGPPLKITVRTFRSDLDFTIPVGSLDACTLELLRDELGKKAALSYQAFLEQLAEFESIGRRLAAQWDQKTRQWISQNLKIEWNPQIPALEDLRSRLLEEFGRLSGKPEEIVQGATKPILQGKDDLVNDLGDILGL